MNKLKDIKEEQVKLIKQAREIWNKQYRENRELTNEEFSEYKEVMDNIHSLEEKIKEEEKLETLESSLREEEQTSVQMAEKDKKEDSSEKSNNKQDANEQDANEQDANDSKSDGHVSSHVEAEKHWKNNQKNMKKEKSDNHRAWIMGIDEIKDFKKEGDSKEMEQTDKVVANETVVQKQEVIKDDKKDKDNGRGPYSLLNRLNRQKQEMSMETKETSTNDSKKLKKKEKPVDKSAKSSSEDPYRDLKNRLHRALIDEIDKEVLQDTENNNDLEEEVTEIVKSLLDSESKALSSKDREKILDEILNEALGFGPITPLIEDGSVSEIMVNGPNQVYVEEEGKLKQTDIKFRDDQHVLHVIEKIVAPLGRRIDESSPLVDARLPDGSRVNAIIPPLALTGPTLTIRKFAEDPLKAKDLISYGTMSAEIADFLKTCVNKRLNIVVSGGTGSGKTTTLNVLSSFIPKNERIVTIEDAAELTLHQDHVVTLETRPPNMEGKGAISMRDLVSNSLRMRPDRIVVGEVRGGEALDMLQAMNTGHDGSLTTGHSNSPRDMLSRLETMVLMAGMDLPIKAIREQVASAIHLIVHQDRLEDGSRKIVKISEVQGMEGDIITMQDLFTFKREGRDSNNKVVGSFESTGFASVFLDSIKNR